MPAWKTHSAPGTPTQAPKHRSPQHSLPERVAAAKAKAQFLGLIEQVSMQRQTVIITKRGKPLVQIVPLDESTGQDPFGCMKGTVKITGDIVGPEPDQWEALG